MPARALRLEHESHYAVFEEIKEHLRHYNIKSVSQLSKVAEPTLYFWLDGTTRKPRIDTLFRVADALGYEIVLRPITGRRHLTVVK